MSQSLVINYMHITFSTKGRKRFIDKHIKDELYAYMARIYQDYNAPILKIGGVEDHIHILCNLSRKIALMKLIEEIKSHSSLWIKEKSINPFTGKTGMVAFR